MTKYFKPNSKKAIKIAKFIKGICAGLAGITFYGTKEHASLIALLILIVGFLANEAINIFSAKKGVFSLKSTATWIAVILKGLCGIITTAAYFEIGSNAALIVAVIGFVANEGINALGTGTVESPKEAEIVCPPESNEIKS